MPLPNPLPLNVGLTEVYEELDALYALQGISDLVGDGVTDDRAQLASDDAALGTGEALILAPGTYLVNSNLTISHVVQFRPGAKIKPASGVTVTFSKGYDAGDFQHVFDISASGIIFSPQRARGYVTPWHFGAVGDGVTDDWAAIRATLDSGAVRIYFPALPEEKSYYSTKCFNLKRRYYIFGDHGKQENGGGHPRCSRIKFANNTCAFIVHRYNTNADDYGYNNTIESPATNRAADDTVITDLQIHRGTGSGTTIDGVTHGIRLRARAHLRNLNIAGFAGNGIHIVASAGGDNESEGNANLFTIETVRIFNCWHGVFVDGPNVNAGYGQAIDVSQNSGWGIFDSSFLGNTWVGCHSAANGLGSYKTDDPNARNVFLGCYQEMDQPDASIVTPSIHVGGLSGVGNGNAKQMANLCGTRREFVPNRTSVNLVTVTDAGSGYASAPTATFGAPTGASTATATATIGSGYLSGKILRINITAGGAGYSAAPAVTIGGDGSGATATTEIQGGIVKSITVNANEAGSGYTTAPVTIAAPTETTATGTAYLNSSGGVAYVVVTNRGSGYTAAPGITLSGGGGSGATATCNLATSSECLVSVNSGDANALLNYTDIFNVSRGDVDANGSPWRLKQLAFTGDLVLDHANSPGRQALVVNGERTANKFGRSVPVPYVQSFPPGIWLGSTTVGRQLTYAAAMPTSGEYARGDFVMNNTTSELGSASSKYILLGWSRLVTGTAHVLNTDWLEARCLTGN